MQSDLNKEKKCKQGKKNDAHKEENLVKKRRKGVVKE